MRLNWEMDGLVLFMYVVVGSDSVAVQFVNGNYIHRFKKHRGSSIMCLTSSWYHICHNEVQNHDPKI